jgi:hypothetical protein
MNVIAQTLSQHTEMIAPGVMGINFMKPEKPINTMSEVYRLVQEEDKVRSPTPGAGTTSPIFKPSKIPPTVPQKPQPPVNTNVPFTPPKPQPSVNTNVPFAPKTPPPASSDGPAQGGPQGGPQGTCTDCGRVIVGPFVSLSDRTLHEDCFRCSTCGSTLKNIGFHNISNKLYCDTHAMLAARVIAGQSTGCSPGSPVAGAPAPYTPAPFGPAGYTPPPLPKTNFGAPSAAPKPVAPAPAPAPVQSAPAPSLTPQPPVIPNLPTSNIPQPVPQPFGHNLVNLPLSPSSSGNLTFRSISPQPFKRRSGDFHKVTAPTSPTPGSAPHAPPAYSSGPLPFEMKPYLPPDEYKPSIFSMIADGGSSTSTSSMTEVSQTSQSTQFIQKSTQVTQQVTQQVSSQQSSTQQYAVNYKQVVGGGQQKTRFVWPPPKPEGDGSNPPAPQNYSPLVTQSTPSGVPPVKNEAPTPFRSVQPPVPSQAPPQLSQEPPQAPEAPQFPAPPSTFSMPPLPTTFAAQPVSLEDIVPALPRQEEVPEPSVPAPAPAPFMAPAPPAPSAFPSGNQAALFAPVLPPIVDLKPTSSAPAQPGVPVGAGSKPAPKKGRGQLMKETTPGRIPICGDCGEPIRGPFIIALSRTWCPDHFHCNNLHCKTPLVDIGFVEEQGQLYCENCYEAFLAPICNKCNVRIKGDCLNALDKQWHPDCFICAYCKKPFGNNSFYLEDGLPYCEKDWNELFTTKCIACGFPIEAGDRWVEALNNNYHSQCFKCSMCNKNLEGQSFYAKGGKPFCKQHAR